MESALFPRGSRAGCAGTCGGVAAGLSPCGGGAAWSGGVVALALVVLLVWLSLS